MTEIMEKKEKKCCSEFYKSPQEAQRGPREKLLFVALPNSASPRQPDCIATIDVDPESAEYGKIVCLLELPNTGDELHHFGWNACASCLGGGGGCCPSSARSSSCRTHLIFPCLASSRIYVVNASQPRQLKLEKTIEPNVLAELGLSHPHTVHCAPDAVMISTIGDEHNQNQGNFLLLDPVTFEPMGKWQADGCGTKFGYDFWFQPRHDVMISTGWGNPRKFENGFWPSDVAKGQYANELYIWEWSTRRLLQTIKLDGEETFWIPLEVRFLHSPDQCHAFVCTALGSAIYHLYRPKPEEPFQCRLAFRIPPKKVQNWLVPSWCPQFIADLLVSMNWALPAMPAFSTDIVISMDDRFLFFSNWLHGDVRQFDISDSFNVRLVGQCFVAGSIRKSSSVKVVEDQEMGEQPEGIVFEDGSRPEGGPQMLQLSLDGRRLYVTTSFYLPWDAQFYPELPKAGAVLVQLDVDTQQGGLTHNKQFPPIKFGQSPELPNGPYGAHEMRYPGGDCTSDIWV